MTEDNQEQETDDLAAEIPASYTRPSKGLSIVWLVPLVALAIAGWLIYKDWSEKGPRITITFKNAEGIEAGKSKIKYKDVEIGEVESTTFSQDMTVVVIKARMAKAAGPYLTDKTRFWIVRPRIAAGQVSGLATLFSGSFIGFEPGRNGDQRQNFTGLEEAPSVTTDEPGKYFILKAQGLGSLDVGSPVYYRQIKVGQVVGYGFNEKGRAVDIKIFVSAPHDQQVKNNTRFWNASGIGLNLDATGIKLETESLASIISGGIAFELPTYSPSGTVAAENTVFDLYTSKNAINEEQFQLKMSWLLYFNQSVRGLSIGSPVEFRGIKIGEVSNIKLDFNPRQNNFRIPVLLTIEPERIFGEDTQSVFQNNAGVSILKDFVNRGLRAVLKNGNLLTGKLLVDFDFYPDEPPQELVVENTIPVMPTRRTELQQITDSLTSVLDKLEHIPYQQISQDLHETLQSANKAINQIPVETLTHDLHETLQTVNNTVGKIPVEALSKDLATTLQSADAAMKQIETLSQKINAQTVPAIATALEQLRTTFADLDASLSNDSPNAYQLRQTLRELSMAARSMQALTDYLERHPDSLIYGKEKE